MRTVKVLSVSEVAHPYNDVPPHVDVTFSDGTMGRFFTERFDDIDPIIPIEGQMIQILDPGPPVRIYG